LCAGFHSGTKQQIPLLKLERDLINQFYQDGESIEIFQVNAQLIIVAIAEPFREFAAQEDTPAGVVQQQQIKQDKRHEYCKTDVGQMAQPGKEERKQEQAGAQTKAHKQTPAGKKIKVILNEGFQQLL
jgi:hypothetical protein